MSYFELLITARIQLVVESDLRDSGLVDTLALGLLLERLLRAYANVIVADPARQLGQVAALDEAQVVATDLLVVSGAEGIGERFR